MLPVNGTMIRQSNIITGLYKNRQTGGVTIEDYPRSLYQDGYGMGNGITIDIDLSIYGIVQEFTSEWFVVSNLPHRVGFHKILTNASLLHNSNLSLAITDNKPYTELRLGEKGTYVLSLPSGKKDLLDNVIEKKNLTIIKEDLPHPITVTSFTNNK